MKATRDEVNIRIGQEQEGINQNRTRLIKTTSKEDNGVKIN